METFKQCNFSTKHLIGDNGNVKRLDKGKIVRYGTDLLTGLIKDDGYKMYFINKKWHYAHRLVAMHCIDNADNLSDVNHKDGDKTNNHYSNLEWVSHRDNCLHRYRVLNKCAPSGKDHHNYGKQRTPESIVNMRNAKLGRKRGPQGQWL